MGILTIVVHSYKGGTGKTTLSIHLAAVLSKRYDEVYLLETDFTMPSFHSIFPKTFRNVEIFSNDVYNNLDVNFEDIFFPNKDTSSKNIHIAFSNPFFNPKDPLLGNDEIWFTKILQKIVLQLNDFKKEHKNAILIIDTPPGYHFVVINNILIAKIALIVVRPNVYAIEGTKRILMDIYDKTRLSKDLQTYILFNQVPDVPEFPELELWKQEFKEKGYEILPDILLDHQTSYYSSKDYSIYPENSFFYQKVKKLSNMIGY